MSKIIEFPCSDNSEKASSLQERRKEAIAKLPGYRGNVQSKNSIRSLPDVKVGEIFWVDIDNKAYLVAEKDRKKMTIKALDETATISTGITIFDMNKSIVSKEPIFDWSNEDAVAALKERLTTWFQNYEEMNDEFFLLYGRDIHYVTLFRAEDGVFTDESFTAIKETLSNVGDLISMDFNSSDNELSIEIWVRTATSPAELLYLFPYDKGVVRI